MNEGVSGAQQKFGLESLVYQPVSQTGRQQQLVAFLKADGDSLLTGKARQVNQIGVIFSFGASFGISLSRIGNSVEELVNAPSVSLGSLGNLFESDVNPAVYMIPPAVDEVMN